MKKRKFQEPFVYFASFFIGTLLFFLFFMIFFQINSYKNNQLIKESVENTNKIFEIGFSNELLGEDICSKEFSENFNKAFYFHVRKISDLENALGKKDWRVLTQKKIYTLAQSQHYKITKKQIEDCNLNKKILFFFYNNSEEKLRDSEVIGELISFIVREREDLQVYSIDSDLEIEIIKKLMEKYEVNYTPSIVLEGKKPVSIKNINDLKKYLDE